VTLKILIGRFSRNFFSRTAEGSELKSGIYVPMNVFNMCCYCLHHCKTSLPSLVLNYIKDCQSILEEIVSADRTKNNNKMAKLSN
jgi:hypothetical protein